MAVRHVDSRTVLVQLPIVYMRIDRAAYPSEALVLLQVDGRGWKARMGNIPGRLIPACQSEAGHTGAVDESGRGAGRSRLEFLQI